MIQIIPNSDLEAKDIQFLRSICDKSISEIREASISKKPIRVIEIFKTGWEEEKFELVEIYRHFNTEPNPPYTVKEVNEYGLNETLTPKKFRTRIEFWRGIELENEMDVELELGEISHPHEFKPSSEDWT